MRKRTIAAAVIAALVALGLAFVYPALNSAETAEAADAFSPEHRSLWEATRHFFGLRPEPVQPIAFVHAAHVTTAELGCQDCHFAASRGPTAAIPDIRLCWTCHETITGHPELEKLKDYHEKGQDIPWQRVWGWNEEAHVRFNHAPHLRAEVSCETCHGNVAEMSVATRVIEHSMGFCIDCHKQRNASNDCTTCHY